MTIFFIMLILQEKNKRSGQKEKKEREEEEIEKYKQIVNLQTLVQVYKNVGEGRL